MVPPVPLRVMPGCDRNGLSMERPGRSKLARAAFWLCVLAALVLPIAASLVLSFVPAKKYEGTVWMILDASRGSQTVAGVDDRRSGNEVVTYDQLLRTQLLIAGSDVVVRKAVQDLLPARLYPDLPATKGASPSEIENIEAGVARGNVILSLEPNTFVFKLAFRHPNAAMAARFANLLAGEFLARRSALYSNEGDVDFFKSQEQRFNDELRAASKSLDEFGRQYSIYSVPEQRKLLLERRATAAKDAADNATQIAKVESELNSLRTQMVALRGKITLPPEIFGDTSRVSGTRAARPSDVISDDPPLLNIKIYQESAARLVSANSELEGLRATRVQRADVLKQIDAELQALATHESTYNTLRRGVSQAEGAIDNLSKRASEARVNNAWRSNEAFSSAQILQPASVPAVPASPRPALYIPVGLIIGVFASLLLLFTGRRFGFVGLKFVPDALMHDQVPNNRVPPEPVYAMRPSVRTGLGVS